MCRTLRRKRRENVRLRARLGLLLRACPFQQPAFPQVILRAGRAECLELQTETRFFSVTEALRALLEKRLDTIEASNPPREIHCTLLDCLNVDCAWGRHPRAVSNKIFRDSHRMDHDPWPFSIQCRSCCLLLSP